MIGEAIILAGGLGTRLRAVVQDLPKPMAPVAGRPFLSYLMDQLVNHGVHRIVLSVHHRREAIEAHFGAAYRGAEVRYAVEEEPCGTGGAVLNSLPFVAEPTCLVVNGDSYFNADLNVLDAFHREHGSLTLALKQMAVADRYGCVQLDAQGRIVAFEEKRPHSSGLINCGVYALDTAWLRHFDLPQRFSLERDFLERIFGDHPIYGIAMTGYFVDIGIPEAYTEAQTTLPALS